MLLQVHVPDVKNGPSTVACAPRILRAANNNLPRGIDAGPFTAPGKPRQLWLPAIIAAVATVALCAVLLVVGVQALSLVDIQAMQSLH
ncbi:hypothetical protein FZ934_22735 (plasmid) [Rhizobium grahamii]|uniref:Uncharacterized protein n=1 Tax=Rhizobium grahamii TaxID=1120045 RepID=A0A5Q0CB37_9HYPH|nr:MULTISPECIES: hypothetical protein [Rhizobium]QFY63128.1 hypothetical protein FZ934_22735 [Rhizobium grahamii]QRM52109.1 hypothetical protein F3Y33_22915 [Rhizobium sp. BG6]